MLGRLRALDVPKAGPGYRPCIGLVPVEHMHGDARDRESERPRSEPPGAAQFPRDAYKDRPLDDPLQNRGPVLFRMTRRSRLMLSIRQPLRR